MRLVFGHVTNLCKGQRELVKPQTPFYIALLVLIQCGIEIIKILRKD